MQTGSVHNYSFGGFQLNTGKRLLRRLDGTLVPLTPRVFETLLYMVEHHDAVLDKERIMEAVWPDSIVEENNLAQAISKLRQIFGETPGSHDYIVTVPGRGYRFVAKVTQHSDEASPADSPEPAQALASVNIAEAGATTGQHLLPGAKTAWLLAAAIGVVALISLAAFFFTRHRSWNGAAVGAPTSFVSPRATLSTRTPIPEKSVAVLPFENLSDDKQNAFFAAGVQDEIISDLARIADLKVISRTSANLYKSGNPRNSREIGQQLGVAHLLEGSVQRIGNRLRVNAQLIRAPTDSHMWAQTYDRDLADLFAIQSEIAQAIAGQLHAKISPSEKLDIERPPTESITAFEPYIQAKNLLLRADLSANAREDLQQATDLLNQAVAHDPSFFDGFCQLGLAHVLLYFYGYDHTSARLALAEAAFAAASRLRPDAGETHLGRAWNIYWGYLDYDGALTELDIARRKLPNDPQILELTGYIHRRQGRWEESIQNLESALELDPRNLDTLQQLALSYGDLARYAEEKSVLARALAIQPNDAATKAMQAVVDLDWRADTRALHEFINEIRMKDPAALQSVADSWLICALAERDPGVASNALAVLGENAFSDGPIQFTRAFIEGLIARMINDQGKAEIAFTAARAEQEKIVEAQPNYGPPLVVLGLIDAALGRKEVALREGRRAVELLPVKKDAVNGRIMLVYLAMIATWSGDNAMACEQLAGASRYTSSLTYGQLKLMPWWDPLRGDPCFEQIIASLASKGN